MCGCQQSKQSSVAAQPARYKVRLINFSEEPKTLTGKISGNEYGQYKNGDRIRILVEDYNAEPEQFVKL